ncbi:hypothetical protein D3C76_581620 [compost metagenome]
MLKSLILAGILATSLLIPYESQNYTVTGVFEDARGPVYHEAHASDGTRLLFLDENLANASTVKVGDKVTAIFSTNVPDDEGELVKVIKK